MANDAFIRKLSKPTRGVLANEIATRETDPHFASLLTILPNPDAILRRLGRGQEVYDAIEYDAHVMGELRTIRAGLLGWEWRLQPGGEEPNDIAAYELCRQVFERRPDRDVRWSDAIWNAGRAVFHGRAMHEVVWEWQDRFIVPGRVIDRPQRRFQFDTDNRLRLVTRGNMMPGEELGEYKWLLTRHMPSHDNPYGVAVFSACFWPWTFKHSGYRYFTKFIERYGIPTPVGKYPRGTPQDQIYKLTDQLAQMVEDAVCAIPDDSSVDLLEHKGGQHSVHNSFLNLCNRELSKALTSQTLATEVQDAGARATAEVGREREEAGQESDREMVQATWQELCDWTTELNFPGARPPVWEFYEEAQISQQTAETIRTIVGFAPLKKSEVYERLQFTPPGEDDEDDDVIFTGGAAQPQPGSPGSMFSASPCPSCGQHHYAAGDNQDALDRLADQADEDATAIFERMAQPIRDLMEQYIQEGKTLEDLRDAIPELYPHISDDELGALLVNYSLVAQLKGMDDAAA